MTMANDAVIAKRHPMTGLFLNGPWEWIIILVIALLLFGHRIPGMARSLGAGITEFRRGLKGGEGGVTSGDAGDTKPGTGASVVESEDPKRELLDVLAVDVEALLEWLVVAVVDDDLDEPVKVLHAPIVRLAPTIVSDRRRRLRF